jgi:hypothetical protein
LRKVSANGTAKSEISIRAEQYLPSQPRQFVATIAVRVGD